MTTSSVFIAIFLLLASSVQAAENNEAEVHRLKAQKYVESKDWNSAETEAKAVTDADSQNLDAWLMYGIIEQRLEKNENAAKAYRHYLDLNPPNDKAEAVRQRLAEVETRAEKAQKEDASENQERYGTRSNGAYFAFSPYYQPSTSTVSGGNVNSDFHLGLQFQHLNLGIMSDSGTVPSFQAAADGASGANLTYQKLGPAQLSTYDLYFEYNIILNEPYTSSLGPFALFIPVHFGIFTNTLKLSNGSRSFSNTGAEGAAGLGVQWFNRSPFSLSLTALYHSGIGFTDLEEDANSQGIQTTAGAPIHGGNAGPEVRLTLTYLFGYEKTLAEKAGVQ